MFLFPNEGTFLSASGCFIILQIQFAFVLEQGQGARYIAFCENCLDIFCADHIIVCSQGLFHTSALKNFADQSGVGEVFIFITKDYFCSAGILKLISCQNGLKKVGISHPDLRVLSRVVFCRCLFFELSRT